MTDFDEVRQQLDLLADEVLLGIVREHDEQQWRPEVFDIARSILARRGVSPDAAPGGDPNEDRPDRPPPEDLITVGAYQSLLEAEADKSALEGSGIESWVLNRYPMQEGVQAELQVRSRDMTAARSVLESEPVPSSDLPPDIAEPPCPQCGSRNVTQGAEAPEYQTVWLYHCASCGHKWE